jgi:cytochrome c1
VCTLLYFSFFLLMPWWSAMGTFKKVPDRVTSTRTTDRASAKGQHMKLQNAACHLALCPPGLRQRGRHPLDKAPDRQTNMAALQHGAKLFVNYCLNCHNASSMRYNRLKDLGLSEEQIKANLLFTGDKVGEMMTTTMNPKDAKAWFGVVPPVVGDPARESVWRRHGSDYLYTYLRSSTRTTPARPAGTTWSCRMWRCRMCCGNCKVSRKPSSWKWPIRTKRAKNPQICRL